MERIRRISIPRSLISPRTKEALRATPSNTKSMLKKSKRELESTLKTSLPSSLNNVHKKKLELKNKLRFKNFNKSRRVINTTDFPAVIFCIDRQKYDKDDIIKIFKQAGNSVKPNEKLLKFNETTMPILNLGAKPNLEFIQASPIKKHSESITRKASVRKELL